MIMTKNNITNIKQNTLTIEAIRALHLEADKMSKEAAKIVFDAIEKKGFVSIKTINSNSYKQLKLRLTNKI